MVKKIKKYNPLVGIYVTILGLILLIILRPSFPEPLNTILLVSFVAIFGFTIYGAVKTPQTKAFYVASTTVAIYVVLGAIIVSTFKFLEPNAFGLYTGLFLMQYFLIAPIVAIVAIIIAAQHARRS